MNRLRYGKQWITDEDIQAVIEVLQSDWITRGPKVMEFEKAVAEYCEVKYAVACNSGTSALHLAYLAAGIKPRDEVITSPITFLATATAILYCGGTPIFADINPDTVNIDPDEIQKRISKNTKVIVPVHFAGNPCDIVRIYKIAKDNGLIVIEDACHALGAKYNIDNKWIKIGSCKHSDMAVFSFHPVKHITTGEGGMITTNNEEFYNKLLILRNHGIVKDPKAFKNTNMAFTGEDLNLWYYEMHTIGFNYWLTDIQCALGISQLKRLTTFVKRRREIASLYNLAFKDIQGVTIPVEKEVVFSSYHLYFLRIGFDKIGKTRNEVMKELNALNISTQVHYIPVHLQPYYKKQLNCKIGDLPITEDFYSKALTIPLYPRMTDEEVQYVISKVKRGLMGI